MSDRAQGAVDALGNKISEKAHEAKKAYHQNQAGLTSDVDTSSSEHKSTTVDSTIKHAGNAACEHAQEINQRDQYELNKNIAQNPDLPVGERAQGAVDALGNKITEKAHEVKKEYHQNQAGLSSDVKTSSGTADTEHSKEDIDQKIQNIMNKNIMALFHQSIPSEEPTVDNTIKHAGLAAQEHSLEIDQKKSQYELNKNITTNPEYPIGERTQAAFEAVGNKFSEKTHEVKKAYHQNQAGITSTDNNSKNTL